VVVADYGVEVDGTGSAPEPAEQVAKEITAAGGEAVACFASVADEAGAASIVQTALDAFGRLDVVINNAGISDPDWFEDESMDRFRRMADFHYFGTAYVCRAAWPHLRAADHGCIVNTTSEAITGFVPKCIGYSGAKGGVFGLTRALAQDGRRFGIRVNAVAPRGYTRMSSPEVLAYVYDQPAENFRNDAFREQFKPEFVSPAVAFLAHESCQLTGEVLVSGGLQVLRLALIETTGITTSETITPEDIAGNLGALMDTTGATVMGLDM
jgi:NAD(P)-dependent dehydrogenase (short-subunit alcohol dehydrogenase family)